MQTFKFQVTVLLEYISFVTIYGLLLQALHEFFCTQLFGLKKSVYHNIGALTDVCFYCSKRPVPNSTTVTSPPTKRKLSPIRFSSTTPTTTGNTRKSAGGTVTKRQSRSVYEPPKGSYSDKLDTSGIADSSWQGGRGRGRRNRRGRGSWRTGGKWAY